MDDAAYEALMARLNEAYPSQPAYTPPDVKLQSGQLTQEPSPVAFNTPRALQTGESNPMSFDPSGGVAQFGAMANAGPLSGMLDMSGQDGMTPGYNAMLTAGGPDGFSTSYRRSNEIGGRGDAQNALTISKMLDQGNLYATANRDGAKGPPAYELGYSRPIMSGSESAPPEFELPSSRHLPPAHKLSPKELVGQSFLGAGHRTGDGETHVRGGIKFNYADGGHVDAALHLLRQHFDEGGFLDSVRNLFSGPDYLSTGSAPSPGDWGNPELASDFFKADKAMRLAQQIQAAEPDRDTPLPPRRPAPEAAPRQQIASPPPAPTTEPAPAQPQFRLTAEPLIGPYDFGQRLAGRQFREAPPHLAETPGFGQSMLDGNKYADMQPEVPTSQLQKYTLPEAALVPPAPQAEISRAVSLAQNTERPPVQPLAYTATPIAAPAAAAIDQATGKLTARAPQDVEQPATNAQILAAIRANESRNNPKAQNPTSSAGGLYQFINSTWGNTLRRMDPEQYGGYSDRQLRGLKTDPNAVEVQHAAANYHLTNDIAPVLSKAGVPLTPGSAYLSWFQGPGGAVKAYTAPDDATVAQVFPKTVSANANMRFNGKPYAQWTMFDLRQWADTAMAKRMGRAEGGEVDAPEASDGVDQALDVVRQQPAEEPRPLTIYRDNRPKAADAGETNTLGMTPEQFAEYTQTKAPPTPSFVEDALRNVREYAMPRGEDYTHAMDQSAAAADYLTKSGKEGMLSGNPLEMAKGAGMSMLGTALPVIAPVGAALEAGVVNPAERVLGPAGRQAAEVATMVPGEGVGAALKIARATGEAAPYAAIFAGPMAKTADLKALETAKDLLSKGETPKSVINQTGWFQGADGKWRFEISDYQSKMNTDPIFKQPSRFDLAGEYLEQQGVPAKKFGTGQFPELDTAGLKYADEIIANRKGVPMEQILEHPDLYAAYPEARNIPVSKTQSANYGGSYDRNSNAITIGEPPLFGGDPDRPRSVALHELQHYIQQEENFARGANPYDLAEHMPSEAAMNDAKILATIQRKGKEYPESWFMEHLGRDPDPIGLYIFRQHSLDEIANMPATPKEAYKRSAGETEARNVQYRRDMPPEELSQKVPWGTQGVLNEHQIVKFESRGGSVEDRALMLVSRQA